MDIQSLNMARLHQHGSNFSISVQTSSNQFDLGSANILLHPYNSTNNHQMNQDQSWHLISMDQHSEPHFNLAETCHQEIGNLPCSKSLLSYLNAASTHTWTNIKIFYFGAHTVNSNDKMCLCVYETMNIGYLELQS